MLDSVLSYAERFTAVTSDGERGISVERSVRRQSVYWISFSALPIRFILYWLMFTYVYIL